MHHIANSARGRMAKNQQELLQIAMNSSSFKDEDMSHLICEVGFSEYGEGSLERMSPDTFYGMLLSLFKTRPSAHLWDVVPQVPHTEDKILLESPEGFRMSFSEKAQYLKEEFQARSNMVGFKLELHNVDLSLGDSNKTQSLSLSIYESTQDLDSYVPVKIRVRYRSDF